MIILRKRNFSTILAVGDSVVNGANASSRSQSYYDSLGKEWGNTSNENLIKSNKGVKLGTDSGTKTTGGNTVYGKQVPKINTEQVAKTSFNNGAKSVGITGGLKNTWAKSGTMGKAGMIGAGIVGAGLLAKSASSMLNGGNKNQ